MNKKLFSIILLIFMLLSNMSLCLSGALSFFTQNNNSLCSTNVVDLSTQCNMLVSIPKDFVNMCVKVQSEMKIFNFGMEKNRNIVADNSNIIVQQIAILISSFKLKFIKYVSGYSLSSLFNSEVLINFIVIPLFIFYLLFYIGLLRLFNGIIINYFYKKFCVKFCLCM